jgi:transcriptional regulator with XRE-family HTH domain
VVNLTSEHLRAARALLRWEQTELANRSGVSKPTIARLETKPGPVSAHGPTIAALKSALEAAGVEFLNGEAPGVRLRKRTGPPDEGLRPEQLTSENSD